MQLNRNVFTPEEFSRIANIEAGRNLRIEQIAGIVFDRDGKQVTCYTTDTALRSGEKRLERYSVGKDEHAIDAFAYTDRVMLLAGTPGIQFNPGRSAVVDGLTALLAREGKTTLVCGKPSSAVGHYLWPHHDVTPVDLGTLGFIEVAYVSRPRGFVARTGTDNRLYFLGYGDAQIGKTTRESWGATNALEGMRVITAIPARITDAKAVMVKATDDKGKTIVVLVNLAGIQQGQIGTIIATVSVNPGATFRGLSGHGVAVVEVEEGTRGLNPGTYLYPTDDLPRLFGSPARTLLAEQPRQ